MQSTFNRYVFTNLVVNQFQSNQKLRLRKFDCQLKIASLKKKKVKKKTGKGIVISVEFNIVNR